MSIDPSGAIRPLVHGTPRNLIRRIPLRVIAHQRDVPSAVVAAARVAQEQVIAVDVLVDVDPRTVVAVHLHAVEKLARPRREAVGRESAEIAVLADAGFEHSLREPLIRRQVRAARGREIRHLGVVRALAVLEPLDELRDQEVQVGVALAVRVRRQVHGHAVDPGCEVRAVVEVEAAQEHLVRLARAAVLRDDQARHCLENLAGAKPGPSLELGRADDALGGRHAVAERVVPAAEHDDVIVDLCGGLREHARGHERGRSQCNTRPQQSVCSSQDSLRVSPRLYSAQLRAIP